MKRFSTEDISLCWGRFSAFRTAAERTKQYYDGRFVIPEQKILRWDKHRKTVVSDSYTKHVTNFHSGYMVSNSVEYAGGNESDLQAIEDYKNILAKNHSDLLDSEHYKNAFLFGYSLELIYNNPEGEIIVEACDPMKWSFVQDDKGVICIAVRRQTIPAGSIYRNNFVRVDQDVYEVFTDKHHMIYDVASMKKLVKETHNLGFCPVHKITLSRTAKPVLGPAFYSAVDNLCMTLGNLSDTIKWNVNSLLAVKTDQATVKTLMETDERGLKGFDQMLQSGTLFMSPESSAQYLSRDVSVQHFIEDIKEIRTRICQAASIPDLEGLIRAGSITGISGTALQTIFYAAQLLAERTEPYLIKGLRERMEIVGKLQKKIGQVAIEYPEKIIIACRKRMPLSIEAIQNVGNLQGILSREDILRVVPQVDNVPAALVRDPMVPIAAAEPVAEPAEKQLLTETTE